MDKIIKFFEEEAEKTALRVYEDPAYQGRDCVGGTEQIEIGFENKKYRLIVSAFWEKARHFGYEVHGIDNNFKHKNSCVFF